MMNCYSLNIVLSDFIINKILFILLMSSSCSPVAMHEPTAVRNTLTNCN